MEYRIKMIQKKSGKNLFVAQYRNENWIIQLSILILFSPIVFVFWLLLADDRQLSNIPNFFSFWYPY